MKPWLTLFWFCLLAAANVVYGYVVTHQIPLFSNLGSSFVTGAGIYIFIIAVSAGLHAYVSRLAWGTDGQRLLSGVAILGAVVVYVTFAALIANLARASFDDTLRIIIPGFLYVSLPILLFAMYAFRRKTEACAVNSRRHVTTATMLLISAVLLYILKAQFELTGLPDLLGRFAIVLIGIIVPSFFFVSALIAALSHRTGSEKYPLGSTILAGIGALFVPLLPLIG